MKRTEEDRLKHEQEDERMQSEFHDYWEGNDQYEEESQSEEDMSNDVNIMEESQEEEDEP